MKGFNVFTETEITEVSKDSAKLRQHCSQNEITSDLIQYCFKRQQEAISKNKETNNGN